jgi:hypothetical protein
LWIESDAVRLMQRRTWTKIEAAPAAVIFHTCQLAGSGLSPPTPACVA